MTKKKQLQNQFKPNCESNTVAHIHTGKLKEKQLSVYLNYFIIYKWAQSIHHWVLFAFDSFDGGFMSASMKSKRISLHTNERARTCIYNQINEEEEKMNKIQLRWREKVTLTL